MLYEEFIRSCAKIASNQKSLDAIRAHAESGNLLSAFDLSYIYLYLNDTENAIKMADFAASDGTPYRVQHAIYVHLAVQHIFPIQFFPENLHKNE